jgi:hypothetical protein
MTLHRLKRLPMLAVVAALAAVAVLVAEPASEAAGGHSHAAGLADPHAGHAHVVLALPTKKQVIFHDQMRKLWEDHITFTRLAIVSFAGNLPDLPATEQRLLANQTDIGNAIKPFYGSAAGDELTALLRTHILTAVDILVAAKAGDQAALTKAEKAWYANANQIADFLSAANPRNWPDKLMRAQMRAHLNETLKEAVDRLDGNFAADIRDYEAVHEHILGMADLLSSGIMAQFPQRFR